MSEKNTAKVVIKAIADLLNSKELSRDDWDELKSELDQSPWPDGFVKTLRECGWIICPPLVGITTPEPQEAMQEGEEEVKVGGSE